MGWEGREAGLSHFFTNYTYLNIIKLCRRGRFYFMGTSHGNEWGVKPVVLTSCTPRCGLAVVIMTL